MGGGGGMVRLQGVEFLEVALVRTSLYFALKVGGLDRSGRWLGAQRVAQPPTTRLYDTIAMSSPSLSPSPSPSQTYDERAYR